MFQQRKALFSPVCLSFCLLSLVYIILLSFVCTQFVLHTILLPPPFIHILTSPFYMFNNASVCNHRLLCIYPRAALCKARISEGVHIVLDETHALLIKPTISLLCTPSPKQPFSFLGQPAINSARHARQLFSSVPAGV